LHFQLTVSTKQLTDQAECYYINMYDKL